MSWTHVADTLSAACFVVGALLTVIAAIGMVRLPDLLSRMHAATKPQVLGLALICLGLALRLRELEVTLFLLGVVCAQMLTSPIASHMVGRASFRAGQVKEELLVVDQLSELEDEAPGAP